MEGVGPVLSRQQGVPAQCVAQGQEQQTGESLPQQQQQLATAAPASQQRAQRQRAPPQSQAVTPTPAGHWRPALDASPGSASRSSGGSCHSFASEEGDVVQVASPERGELACVPALCEPWRLAVSACCRDVEGLLAALENIEPSHARVQPVSVQACRQERQSAQRQQQMHSLSHRSQAHQLGLAALPLPHPSEPQCSVVAGRHSGLPRARCRCCRQRCSCLPALLASPALLRASSRCALHLRRRRGRQLMQRRSKQFSRCYSRGHSRLGRLMRRWQRRGQSVEQNAAVQAMLARSQLSTVQLLARAAAALQHPWPAGPPLHPRCNPLRWLKGWWQRLQQLRQVEQNQRRQASGRTQLVGVRRRCSG